MIYPKPLEDLVKQLQKLPTIGPKTAQRLAFSILKMSEEEVAKISRDESIKENTRVIFENDNIKGSISLTGSTIDDLEFKTFFFKTFFF